MCTGAEAALLVASIGSTAIAVEQQRDVAKFQAGQARANADAEKQAGEIRAQKARDRAQRLASTARATLAASGIDIDSVTANLINKDILIRGERDAFVETLDAEDRATALRQQADIFSLRKQQATIAGGAQTCQHQTKKETVYAGLTCSSVSNHR